MKIAFVVPRPDYNPYAYLELMPLGVSYLGTILKNKNHNVVIYNENIKGIYDKENKKIIDDSVFNAEIIGISIIASTANRGYEIAAVIKKEKPEIKIIIGGPHATFMSKEAAEYADHVVRGEAESVISDLVEGKIKEKIINGEKCENLDDLPFPDFSLIKNFEDNFRKKLKRIFFKKPAPISTSRGCPYNCNYCSVTEMFGRKYRFRSDTNILKEIKQRCKEGYKNFFFYDDNFSANRERTKKLLKKIIKSGLKIKWNAQDRVEIAKDEELIRLMAESGCSTLFIGVESSNPAVLEDYDKKQNVEDIKNCINLLHNYGIKVHAFCMAGSDKDNEETIRETVMFCNRLGIETAQFPILFPIPGTKLYYKLKSQKRILTENWRKYDGRLAVFKPKNLSVDELQKEVLKAWKRFYSVPKILKFLSKGQFRNFFFNLLGRYVGGRFKISEKAA